MEALFTKDKFLSTNKNKEKIYALESEDFDLLVKQLNNSYFPFGKSVDDILSSKINFIKNAIKSDGVFCIKEKDLIKDISLMMMFSLIDHIK